MESSGFFAPDGGASPRLLEQMRQVMRLHHYSVHTDRAYVDWVVRHVRFHRLRSRAELYPAEPKIEAFLTHLAVEGRVAPAGVRGGLRVGNPRCSRLEVCATELRAAATGAS